MWHLFTATVLKNIHMVPPRFEPTALLWPLPRGSSLTPHVRRIRLDIASAQVRRSRYQPFCRRALAFIPCSSQGEHASSASTSSDSPRTPPSDDQFLLPTLFRILSSLCRYLVCSIWPSLDQDWRKVVHISQIGRLTRFWKRIHGTFRCSVCHKSLPRIFLSLYRFIISSIWPLLDQDWCKFVRSS